ncbi:hypothetical protein [Candidatus Accumulibacter cognatus]|uniref:Uncharacterized protein n=1 Tax=Candidatus Accumulibacter cognatus TaxID=2954383 RepID=A0A080M5D4_9PROT|nr:hypothetical protein [Candidatus Accumulibacter cognatus]KFB75690.1 MAG: hypothetical protein AW06_003231 [Candidatus Accumulibacter cognatus]
MSVSSIGSSSSNLSYSPAVKAQAEAVEAQQAGRDVGNDVDTDDGGAAVKEPAPTVNLNGQTVGTRINTSA